MKYVPLFVLIQLVNLLLLVLGLFVCLLPRFAKFTWLWWNNIDPPSTNQPWWPQYYWLALRNPVSNLRLVPGVSKPGRPLWYWSNGKYYAKAGWTSNGYPVLSAGSGKGY